MPKIVDKAAKRLSIIDVAHTLFHEKGYKSVTTREIASVAGVSKGVLYDYFKNKEDLFYQTISEKMCNQLFLHFAQADNESSPRQRFDGLKDLVSCNAENKKKRFFLMFDFYVNCPDQAFKDDVFGNLFETHRKFFGMLLKETFPDAVDTLVKERLAASIFTACIDGLFIQKMLDPKGSDFEQSLELFWSIMIQHMENCEKH